VSVFDENYCGSCFHWCEIEGKEPKQQPGICRRFPPIVVSDSDGNTTTEWPLGFSKTLACGEFSHVGDLAEAEDESCGHCYITEDHLHSAFEKTPELKSSVLVKRLAEISEARESTCWRAIGVDGYLRPLLKLSAVGKLKLKEGK
jgi:hypothetical protein